MEALAQPLCSLLSPHVIYIPHETQENMLPTREIHMYVCEREREPNLGCRAAAAAYCFNVPAAEFILPEIKKRRFTAAEKLLLLAIFFYGGSCFKEYMRTRVKV